jgi:hypothetical protein
MRIPHQGRPLGFLVAWLRAGLDPSLAIKADHLTAKKAKNDHGAFFTWDIRKACRQSVESDPAWEVWQEESNCRERPLRTLSEPREPERFS